jgi:hypothetical protein
MPQPAVMGPYAQVWGTSILFSMENATMEPFVFKSDEEEIERAIKTLFDPDTVVELRALKVPKGRVVSGYFDGQHRAELIQAAMEFSGQAQGIYVTLNPVDPTVMARSFNRAKRFAENTTGDKEILRRAWLPIDFDPIRPAGISSTDAEHQAAVDRAKECRAHLHDQGWPDPILADSGNGAHLLCRIDLPNDQASTDLIKRVLEDLATRFSDSVVNVDRSVYNPARIWKLYGTLSAKGDSTPDRPHRIARMLEMPRQPERSYEQSIGV